jgi:tetratricopeptide (TPR) repeat protein
MPSEPFWANQHELIMATLNPNTPGTGGGSVAIRGFLVQTLVALLEVVKPESTFTEITLEPAVGDDQFDFLWKNKDGSYATQVKSTVNSFTKVDVEKWADKLRKARTDEKCTLMLVGNIPSALVGSCAIAGVLIQTKNLHLGDLVEQAAQRLAKFLESEQMPAGTALQREVVVHALTSHLEHLATKSEPLSRESFLALLRQWINSAPNGYAQVDLSHFEVQKYAPAELVGRKDEIVILDQAWLRVIREEKPRAHVLTFVALGGEGKTSLVAKWAAELAAQDWPGCDAAFAWSFYSQGTREQLAATSDLFLKEALTFFGDDADKAFAASAAGAFEKGQRLARIVGQRRSLLILDGLEPLQYAPTSPTPGQLKDQGITALLKGLAAASRGLCVVTTRYSLPDLRAFWQTTAPEVKLLRLSREAGVQLLKTLGVNGSAQEFETLVEDVKGHALTLTLLGGFLKRAFHGDIRQRDRVKFEKADERMDGGHAFRTMAAYEQWLLRDGGDEGRREVAVLRLMGLFDRPADAGCLAALRSQTIPGLTEPLIGLADDDWEYCLSGLEAAKLLTVNCDASGALVSLDAHPHLREYFARQLRTQQPDAWRAAHRRLYEYLCANTPDKPQPTLEDLQPLFQSVRHACDADEHSVAWSQIYRPRIQKGDDYFAFHRLGAFGTILSALACFFESHWRIPVSCLAESERGELLNNTGYALWGLARGDEALVCFDTSLAAHLRLSDWKESAIDAENLAELCLTLGKVDLAVEYAQSGVEFADRSTLAIYQRDNRAVLGHCLHMAGDFRRAGDVFAKAETFERSVDDVSHTYLGFLHLELLLDKGEFKRVSEIASAYLASASPSEPILRLALHRLALARAIFEAPQGVGSSSDTIQELLNKSIHELRQSGRHQDIPRGLLAHATLFAAISKFGDARTDLDEAWEIAERGPMRLHMADIYLYRARLFFREKEYPWKEAKNWKGEMVNDRTPKDDLNDAEFLITTCGYHRRDEELADAKRAILGT